MEKKKYELVAWTRKVEGQEDPDLMMIPSLHYEMQGPYIKGIAYSRSKGEKARIYEQNARFLFKTGYYGDGLRFLCKAALLCVPHSELYGEFLRLAEEFITLTRKYGRFDLMCEKDGRNLAEHLENMKARK